MPDLDEEIKKMTVKIELLENEILVAKQCNRSEAYLINLGAQLNNLGAQLVELRKEKNILLSISQKSGIYFHTMIIKIATRYRYIILTIYVYVRRCDEVR